MIAMWGGQVAPIGWLECNGQSTAAYPLLGQIVGAAVPDLRGEFIRGWDHGRGVDTGRTFGSAQADEFKSHTHGNVFSGGYAETGNAYGWRLYPDRGTTDAAGGAETRPRNIALMYIIKHD
jgi:microcystin-dependent protein